MAVKCTGSYRSQRVRQFDGGYPLARGGTQRCADSAVGVLRRGYRTAGEELSRGDGSHAVEGEGVGGIGGGAGVLLQGEAVVALGFGHRGECDHPGVVAAGGNGDRLGGRGSVARFGRGEGERSRMGHLEAEGTIESRRCHGGRCGRSRNGCTGQEDVRRCILNGTGYRGGVGWGGSAATGRWASGEQQCRGGQCARQPRKQ